MDSGNHTQEAGGNAPPGPGGQEIGPDGDGPPTMAPDHNSNYTRAFSRTFHNVLDWESLDKEEFTAKKISADALNNPDKVTPVSVELDMTSDWVEIPYYYLNGSMTLNDAQSHFVNCQKWRVVACGFELGNIVPLEDTIKPDNSISTSFNQRPYMFTYTDDTEHVWPIGMAEQPVLPNDYLLNNVPKNRAESQLKNIQTKRIVPLNWLQQAIGTDIPDAGLIGDPSIFGSIFNTSSWGILQAGQRFNYQWNNPSKLWYPASAMSFNRQVVMPQKLFWQNMPAEIAPYSYADYQFKKIDGIETAWTPTQTPREALDYPTAGSQWPREIWQSGEATLNPSSSSSVNYKKYQNQPKQTGKIVTTLIPFVSNDPPPRCALRLPTIWDANGNAPMKIGFSFTLTYFSKIEFIKNDSTFMNLSSVSTPPTAADWRECAQPFDTPYAWTARPDNTRMYVDVPFDDDAKKIRSFIS